MFQIRRITRQMGSLVSSLSLLTMALVTAQNAASANPNLTPGVWTNITPAAAKIGIAYGLNYFTGNVSVDPGNPNNLYFCTSGYTAAGGEPGNIWKSTDGGSTWNALTPLDAPTDVHADPFNSNHVYAVDGVRGSTLGFWVSNNGGATWTQPAGWTTLCNNLTAIGQAGFNDARVVSIDPSNGNHILVASHSGCPVVAESFDGGNTWTYHVTPAAATGGYSVYFLYNPSLGVGNAQTWFFCTQTDGMYRTTNSGSTWTKVTTISAIHGGNQICYMANGNLMSGSTDGPMKSTDNGVTWQLTSNFNGSVAGITGDGTNLYTGRFWQAGVSLTSPESDGLNWTPYNGGNPQFVMGPVQMDYDKVNGIVYSSISPIGIGCPAGDGIWALKVISGSGPPSAPSGLVATGGNAQAALTWNASSGATAYDVKRSTVSGSGYAAVSSPTVTNYTNTGLSNGTTYYFVVDAKNANGTSGNSNQASATPSTGSSVTVDDPAASITYTGLWNGQSISGYYLGTAHVSGTANDFATFTFTGTSIQWIGAKNTDHAIANVYIDGALITAVDGYATSWLKQQVLFSQTGLTNASHTIKIVNTGTKNASSTFIYTDIDAFIYGTGGGSAPPAPTGLTATPGNSQVALAWTASSGATSYNVLRSTVNGSGYASVATGVSTTAYTNTGLTNGTTYYFVATATNASGTSGNSNQASATPTAGSPVTVDDPAASITYTGLWNGQNISGYYLGTAHVSGTANDFATFTFTGTSIQWIGAKNTDHAIANVYIDGTLITAVDGYATSWLKQQVLFSRTGLTSGSHTIKIVNTGTKNASSTFIYTDVDAFIYTP